MFPSNDDASASLPAKTASIEGQLMHPAGGDGAIQEMLADSDTKVQADKAAEPPKRAVDCSEADLMFPEDAELGRGGEATVLVVRHGGKHYAYKKYHHVHGTDDEAVKITAAEAAREFKHLVKAFMQADAVTSVCGRKHRNVVEPVCIVTDPAHGGQVSGFLMRLLRGQSLWDSLTATPAWRDASPDAPCPLTLRAAACIAAQVCRGALAFHCAGLVHRDIKPPNLVLRRPLKDLNEITLGNELVLVDGGLVSAGPGPLQRRKICSIARGTVHFMAAEQVNNKPDACFYPTPAIDSVAVGRTCLYLYLWRMPGDGMKTHAIEAAIRDGTLMSEVHPQCALPAPAAFVNVALWLAHTDSVERLSVEAALPIFLYMHDRAAAGHEVALEDVRAQFSLEPHPLLGLYPTTGRSGPVPMSSRNPQAAHDKTVPDCISEDATILNVEATSPSSTSEDAKTPEAEEKTCRRSSSEIAQSLEAEVTDPSCASEDAKTLEAEEKSSPSCGSWGADMDMHTEPPAAPHVSRPSLADLHCTSAFQGMAAALNRSSAPGVQRFSGGKGVCPALPEIKRAASGPCGAMLTVGSGGIAELAHEQSDSMRISAFGERFTVDSCAGREDTAAGAAEADAVSMKASEQGELRVYSAAEVAGEHAKDKAGLLRRMRVMWNSSIGRVSTAMVCRGIAVQQ